MGTSTLLAVLQARRAVIAVALLLAGAVPTLLSPSVIVSDGSGENVHVSAAALVQEAVVANPHSFRAFHSPFYVLPRSTDVFGFMIYHWPDYAFAQNFRMGKATFFALVGTLRPLLERTETRFRKPISVEVQVPPWARQGGLQARRSQEAVPGTPSLARWCPADSPESPARSLATAGARLTWRAPP